MSDRTAPPFSDQPPTAMAVLDDLVLRLLDAREAECARSRQLIAEMPPADSGDPAWREWYTSVSEGHARHDGLKAAGEIVERMRMELGR